METENAIIPLNLKKECVPSVKYLRQMLLIMLFSFLGELLHSLISLPIPASIYGMVLLFAAMSLKLVKLRDVKDAGSFLVSFLPVLFVAPIVSLIDCWDKISPNLLSIAVIFIVSTLICFAVSGWVTQAFMRHQKGDRSHG